ncbi:MAG: hypothetical protein K0R67_2835, partial [Paenibacillus sp.]|nr:hypothetical protein [Paenibacillus sp.]
VIYASGISSLDAQGTSQTYTNLRVGTNLNNFRIGAAVSGFDNNSDAPGGNGGC